MERERKERRQGQPVEDRRRPGLGLPMERALTAPSKSKELHEVVSGVGLPTLIRKNRCDINM